MNEELQDKILSWVEKVEAATSQGSSFVAEEAPKVAAEYLAFVWWQAIIGIVIHVVIVLCVYVAAVRIIPIVNSDSELTDNQKDSNWWTVVIVAALVIAAATAFATIAYYNLLKVMVAPRFVIVEGLQDLIK